MDASQLPRREREIYEIVVALREASAVEIRARMTSPPSYSAVRALLSRLVAKGALAVGRTEQAHVYRPLGDAGSAERNALGAVVATLFQGSPARAAMALLGSADRLTDDEAERLHALIEASRRAKS